MSATALVGIDWGTSAARAYRFDAGGQVVERRDLPIGIRHVRDGRFDATLAKLIAGWDIRVPRIASGMIGSRQGWVEAPYVECPASLTALGDRLVRVPHNELAIVPGVVTHDAAGIADVMRGEETQLLGAVALGHRDGRFVLPGTHSKWVALRDGRIEAFSTYLSGELFALLSQHGTLAALMREPMADEAAFAEGVRASGRAALSHALFECRARVVAGDMAAASARDHLSGVLLGAEWHDALHRFGRAAGAVRVIGDAALARRHVQVAQQLGVPITRIDARDAQLAAWSALSTS